MSPLELWLAQATRSLSADAAAQVRSEIQQHYDDALAHGADALTALGDPRAANREYRKVMLTAAEAKHLRSVVGEARALCRRPGMKNALIGTPILLLCFSSAAYFGGALLLAKALFALGAIVGVWLAVPFLPIYTVPRSRIYRAVKWASFIGGFALVSGGSSLWILPSILSFSLYQEFLSLSIRRKLPVEEWPKELYL